MLGLRGVAVIGLDFDVPARGMSRASAFHRSYRPLWDGPAPAPSAMCSISDLDAAERRYVATERAAYYDPSSSAPRRSYARAALLRMGVIRA